MSSSDIIGLIITGILGLAIIVGSIFLLMGKGSFLIAGYNTMPKEERDKYDKKGLSRFMGKILLPIGLLCPTIALAGIFNIHWLNYVDIGIILGLIVFALIYLNTGHRFKK